MPKADYERIFEHFKQLTDAEHDEVVALGGLHIVGTERHEARRIDNQLRGRAGRQGDPGSSRFYLSLEDDLMRIFGSDRISGLMQKLGMEEGVPIEHGMVTRAIERAQKQVEAQNFSVRKHLLEYDDVMNKQRENIYALRREILEGKIRFDEDEEVVDTRDYLMSLAEDILDSLVETYAPREADFEQWDLDALKREVDPRLRDRHRRRSTSATRRPTRSARRCGSGSPRPTTRRKSWSAARCCERVERDIMLQIVDAQWKDHLYSLDHLKEGIGLRGYGQRDPLVEYKKESFALFQAMKERVDEEIVRYLWWLRPVHRRTATSRVARRCRGRPPPRRAAADPQRPVAEPPPAFVGAARGARAASPHAAVRRQPRRAQPARVGGDDAPVKTVRRDEPKVGRNDPCPCGSGKKYKKCHGAAA